MWPGIQYYQAEQTGWVLYVEGSTDLAILQSFAKVLGHPAQAALERPFVHYVENQPQKARDHFWRLREAKPNLVGLTLCDRLDRPLKPTPELHEVMWRQREIENYLCQPETLRAFAAAHERDDSRPLFAGPDSDRRTAAMDTSIRDNASPAVLRNRSDPWWEDVKASDDFLDRVFKSYLELLELPLGLIRKHDYHVLAPFVPLELLSPEVTTVLDTIAAVAATAQPGAGHLLP